MRFHVDVCYFCACIWGTSNLHTIQNNIFLHRWLYLLSAPPRSVANIKKLMSNQNKVSAICLSFYGEQWKLLALHSNNCKQYDCHPDTRFCAITNDATRRRIPIETLCMTQFMWCSLVPRFERIIVLIISSVVRQQHTISFFSQS